jgi:hypothetical protein
MRRAAFGAALLSSVGGDAAAGSPDPLQSHFRSLHKSKAQRRRAQTLPASAAAPVLKFDPSVYADDWAPASPAQAHADHDSFADGDQARHEASAAQGAHSASEATTPYDLMLEHEVAARASAPGGTRLPYVLCGPQRSATDARRGINAATGSPANSAPEVKPR